MCVGVREGGEGGGATFKILRKHLRKEGDGVSGGRVGVGWNPLACGVCLVGIARACLRQKGEPTGMLRDTWSLGDCSKDVS